MTANAKEYTFTASGMSRMSGKITRARAPFASNGNDDYDVPPSAAARVARAHREHATPELLPPSPGEVLRGILDRHELTQDALAAAMGVSRYSINQLVNDRRGVTAEMALRMATALRTSAEFWLNLQRNVDLALAQKTLVTALMDIHPVIPGTGSES